MTSYPGLGSPSFGFLQSTIWRAGLALVVVFVMLAMSGWTAIRNHRSDPDPLTAEQKVWSHTAFLGRHLPDPHGRPATLRAFFARLSHPEQSRLAHRFPLAVGNMGGAPVTLRYQANRIALDTARAHQEKLTHDRHLTPLGRQTAGRLMHRYASMESPGRQILAFDPANDGRAAEVFGDLDRADRVSVVVPGVDTNLMNFEKTARPTTAPAGMGRSLYDAERDARPSAHTAVIAWADYTSPVGVGMEAATGTLASAGAVRLNALVRSLPTSDDVSLFCHSYGSVVCGVGARSLPSNVSDIAVAGSPGMRVRNATGLGTHARVWAMRDANDWIQDVPYMEVGGLGHGADPVSAGFGSRVLSAHGANGHAGYFAPGTESLRNFARVGVGDDTAVHCAPSDRGCASDLA